MHCLHIPITPVKFWPQPQSIPTHPASTLQLVSTETPAPHVGPGTPGVSKETPAPPRPSWGLHGNQPHPRGEGLLVSPGLNFAHQPHGSPHDTRARASPAIQTQDASEDAGSALRKQRQRLLPTARATGGPAPYWRRPVFDGGLASRAAGHAPDRLKPHPPRDAARPGDPSPRSYACRGARAFSRYDRY